jgi:hypothetical protein
MELRAILDEAGREAVRIIKLLPDETFSQSMRISQYRSRGRQIDSVMSTLWGDVQTSVQRKLFNAADLATDANELILAQLGRRLGAAFDPFQLANRQVLQVVKSRLINDIELSPRVYRNRALATGQINDLVNNSLVLGRSAKEIAVAVRRYILPQTPGGASYAAMRLGRTEINNAFHTTQTRSYAKQPWITGVKWNVSGSHPRPDICNEYADNDHDDLGAGVFRPNNVPGKPHPQCLCHITAVTVSREDFIDTYLAGGYTSYLNETAA